MQPIAHKIVDSIEYKRCSACKQWKVLDEFSKESRRRDSLADKCKHCKGILHRRVFITLIYNHCGLRIISLRVIGILYD